MTRERFFDALDAIDIDIVEDFVLTDNALEKRSEHKKPKYLKWTALAACLVLVVCFVPFIKNIFTPSHVSSPVTVRYDSFEELSVVLPYNNFYKALDSENANTVSIGMSYASDKDGNAITTQPLQLKIRQTYECENYTDTVDFYIIFGKTDVNESYIAGYEEQGLTKEINGITVHYSMIDDGAKHAQGKFIYEGNLYVVDVLSGGSEYVLDEYLYKVIYTTLYEDSDLEDSYIALELEDYNCPHPFLMRHHDDIKIMENVSGDSVPREITVMLYGEEVLLHYDQNSNRYASGRILDHYENDDATVTTWVIRGTDNYMGFLNMLMPKDTSVKKTRDECFLIAQNYLSRYTDDVDSYVLTKEDEVFLDKNSNGYSIHNYDFTFRRKIGDTFVEDEFIISVEENGDIFHIDGTNTGTLEGVVADDIPNADTARPYALQKLKAVCNDMWEYSYTFKEKNIRVEAIEGGIVALTYTFDVTFTPREEGKQEFGDLIRIVVYKKQQ